MKHLKIVCQGFKYLATFQTCAYNSWFEFLLMIIFWYVFSNSIRDKHRQTHLSTFISKTFFNCFESQILGILSAQFSFLSNKQLSHLKPKVGKNCCRRRNKRLNKNDHTDETSWLYIIKKYIFSDFWTIVYKSKNMASFNKLKYTQNIYFLPKLGSVSTHDATYEQL